MKLLLNVALIATLSAGTLGCTVLVDPSSGSSATTGGSSSSAFMDRQQQIAEFATVNFDRIRQDMSAGQGEYLASLATLLGVEPASQPAFFAFVRDQFTALFPSDQTTATDMLATLEREMQADPRFGRQLALR